MRQLQETPVRGMRSGGQGSEGSGQLGVGAAEASGDDKEITSKLSRTGGKEVGVFIH